MAALKPIMPTVPLEYRSPDTPNDRDPWRTLLRVVKGAVVAVSLTVVAVIVVSLIVVGALIAVTPLMHHIRAIDAKLS